MPLPVVMTRSAGTGTDGFSAFSLAVFEDSLSSSSLNIFNMCNANKSSPLSRGKYSITSGTKWSEKMFRNNFEFRDNFKENFTDNLSICLNPYLAW